MSETQELISRNFIIYVIILGAGFCICWTAFWMIFRKKGDTASEILGEQNILSVLTVIVAATFTFTLGILRVLEGNSIAAIFGGIVGYVLGAVRSRST